MYVLFERMTINDQLVWVVTGFFKSLYEVRQVASSKNKDDYVVISGGVVTL